MTPALKAEILKAVEETGPCRPGELYSAILELDGVDTLMAVTAEGNIIPIIDEMVANGELIEIEYGLPRDYYDDSQIQRVKSLLFPAGTTIAINDRTTKV